MSLRQLIVGALFLGGFLTAAAPVRAQGLIWNLPEEGAWVRYEGNYVQKDVRPDLAAGSDTLQWRRHLWLKSLDSEPAEYQGETVPCRWIEIKVVTGVERDGVIDPGPAGERIFKVLVPEHAVIGDVADGDGIPVAYLPIVTGYRRIGEGEVTPLASNSLQVYPVISLLLHYRNVEATGETEDVTLTRGNERVTVAAEKLSAAHDMESPVSSSSNEAELLRSDDVPFGLAGWTVRVDRRTKGANQPRSEFQEVTSITVEMKAQQAGTGAMSELATP